MLKLTRKSESGRSMIEMLGVLAVIGVLSVGGITGYTTAMNSHYANQAADQARRLAAVASAKRLINPSAHLIAEELGGNFTMDETETGYIKLTMTGLSEAVRNRIKDMDLGIAKVDEGETDGSLVFTFKNDLSEFSESSSGTTEDQGESPADYDNDQDACETANYVYCPATNQCIAAGNACPCPADFLAEVDAVCMDDSSGTCKLKPAGSACSLDMPSLVYGTYFNGQCNKSGQCRAEGESACNALGENWIPLWIPESGSCCVAGTSWDAAHNFLPTKDCCEAEFFGGNYTGGFWYGEECCLGPMRVDPPYGVTQGCCEAFEGTYFPAAMGDGIGFGPSHNEAFCCDQDGNLINGSGGETEENEVCAQLMNAE